MNENLERQAQAILLAFKDDFERMNIEINVDMLKNIIITSGIRLDTKCILKKYTIRVVERNSTLAIVFEVVVEGMLKEKYVELCILANKIKSLFYLNIKVVLDENNSGNVILDFFQDMNIASKECKEIDPVKVTKCFRQFVAVVEYFENELSKLLNGQLKIEEILQEV